jgi:hypothetical protein
LGAEQAKDVGGTVRYRPYQFIPMRNYDHLSDVFPEGWPAKVKPTELKDPKVLAAFDGVVAFLRTHLEQP